MLEYKLYKEKVIQQYSTFQDVINAMKDINIQFGNLIFYNFDIPAIKKKSNERNFYNLN